MDSKYMPILGLFATGKLQEPDRQVRIKVSELNEKLQDLINSDDKFFDLFLPLINENKIDGKDLYDMLELLADLYILQRSSIYGVYYNRMKKAEANSIMMDHEISYEDITGLCDAYDEIFKPGERKGK